MDTWCGLKIIVDDAAVTSYVEDWSRVRSPSRAERRRKRGFRQNITMVPTLLQGAYRVGDTYVISSTSYRKLQEMVDARGYDGLPGGQGIHVRSGLQDQVFVSGHWYGHLGREYRADWSGVVRVPVLGRDVF